MLNVPILLADEDPVFLRGNKAFALVHENSAWHAHEISIDGARFVRSPTPSGLSEATVRGVICQSEHFRASQLDQHWPLARQRKLCADIEAASAGADAASRRAVKTLKGLHS